MGNKVLVKYGVLYGVFGIPDWTLDFPYETLEDAKKAYRSDLREEHRVKEGEILAGVDIVEVLIFEDGTHDIGQTLFNLVEETIID